ncbi:MAG TPA: hypothetical protein VJ646_14095 [Candidatus Binatia bacterium]|nr:hypothetical protein [Candidatus Binatia bacterium]
MPRIVTSWFSTLSRKFTVIAVRRCLSVTLIGLLGFAGSAAVGIVAGIPAPAGTDEFSYLLAADTFAHRRLTNPPHPLWVHFESVHIIQQPTYMSKYPPAQGLVLAAGQVLAGQPIVGVWMSFALMCAAICWMLYAWVPPRWALLGGFLAVINPQLGIAGYWAQSYWGGAVPAIGGALLLGGVRRLMRRPRVNDALLTSMGLAILANSRPYEGLLISLPAGVILLLWILSKRGPPLRVSLGQIVLPTLFALALTGAAMGLYNLRVTGNALRLPYQVHEESYGIAPLFIWQSLPPEPAYRHQALRDRHRQVGRGLYDIQRSVTGFLVKNTAYLSWWGMYSLNIFAIPLIATLPLMVTWALRDRWARFALLTYVILIAGVLLETFMMIHYLAPITAFNYFFVLSAMRLWRWRDKRIGQTMSWVIPLLAAIMLVASLGWTINRDNSSAWQNQRARLLKQLKQQDGYHLIIVSYRPTYTTHWEWVYNEADIDGAKVVWARRMDDDHNCQLLEYFKDRHIWSLELDASKSIPRLTPYPRNLCR